MQDHSIKDPDLVPSWDWADISLYLISLDFQFQGQTPSSALPGDTPGTGAYVVRTTTLPSSLCSLPNFPSHHFLSASWLGLSVIPQACGCDPRSPGMVWGELRQNQGYGIQTKAALEGVLGVESRK